MWKVMKRKKAKCIAIVIGLLCVGTLILLERRFRKDTAINLTSESVTVSILGDSYSTYEGFVTPNTNITYYPNVALSRGNDITSVDQTWWKQVIDCKNYILDTNNSYSGSWICNGLEVSTSFITRMENIGNPDLILIFGGINDWSKNAQLGDYIFYGWTDEQLKQFRPALAYMFDYLKSTHPCADIQFILADSAPEEYRESIKKICQRYMINLIEIEGAVDKVDGHPTQKGMNTISEIVLNGLGNPTNHHSIDKAKIGQYVHLEKNSMSIQCALCGKTLKQVFFNDGLLDYIYIAYIKIRIGFANFR